MSDDEVRPLSSARSVREKQRQADAEHARKVAVITAALEKTGVAKMPVEDDAEAAEVEALRKAGRDAGKALGRKIRTQVIPGAVMVVVLDTEEPSPLREQVDTIRLRHALDRAWDQHR